MSEGEVEQLDVDVAISGYGPGAQTLAALLTSRGWSVVAFERYPGLYNNARAGHIDHEVLRTAQAVSPEGAADLEATMHPALEEYVWLNGDGDVILHQPHVEPGKRSVSGWYSDYTLWQPNLEDVLAGAAAGGGADVRFGWEVVDHSDHGDHVEVMANKVTTDPAGRRDITDEYVRVRARYFVGADGASSPTRRSLGIPRSDDGVDEMWLVCDMRTLDESHVMTPFIAQICDPARPRLVMPLGRTHRRFEWRILPDESPEELGSPDRVWELLSEYGVTPQTHEIARLLPYRFQARTAERWRRGNVFLVGDAAHTMPPYAGQGLCGAVRDGANLAWKLDVSLRGFDGHRVLDSYEQERRAHHLVWTDLSVAEGRISNVLDPALAAERDRRLREEGLEIPHLPTLTSGLLRGDDDAAGTIAPQCPVRRGTVEGLLESVLPGSRFRLLLDGLDSVELLGGSSTELLQRLGAEVVSIGRDVDDVTGGYRRWFDEHHAVAVLYRPDFYIFGVAGSPHDVDGLVDELRRQLTR